MSTLDKPLPLTSFMGGPKNKLCLFGTVLFLKTSLHYINCLLQVYAPTVVAPLWWWVGPVCRDRNDHKPIGSSYVTNRVLFCLNNTHDLGCLNICTISK